MINKIINSSSLISDVSDLKENEYIKDFPLLNNMAEGKKRLVYLDNAATTQKPLSVINAVKEYYGHYNANPHRGAYGLSSKATQIYEDARECARRFINAKSSEEIIFTKGATEGFNMIASSFGEDFICSGDEILLSIAEHHSNLIPWQLVAKKKGAILKYMYTEPSGEITTKEITDKINERTKLVAITHVSNVLGLINPVEEIIRRAHKVGAVVVMDAAQSIPHIQVDVQKLNVDFMVFSGHKMLAPMGIGVLYGKKKLLDNMRPLLYGGGMVESVTEQDTVYAEAPYKFEGGTQNVEAAYGLMKAMEYIDDIGYDKIAAIEDKLTAYAIEKLEEIPYITIYVDRRQGKGTGVISFGIEGVHPHDVSTVLDAYGVAIRSGHHCAQPLMNHLGIHACCRISLYFYNSMKDIDCFIDAIKNVRRWLGLGA
ncbi:MAG: cysteine desulfurase [Anaerolineaceae bacterium]|nr:MAG: cysteine desulfurase [Anaerolineaceae bacterium]